MQITNWRLASSSLTVHPPTPSCYESRTVHPHHCHLRKSITHTLTHTYMTFHPRASMKEPRLLICQSRPHQDLTFSCFSTLQCVGGITDSTTPFPQCSSRPGISQRAPFPADNPHLLIKGYISIADEWWKDFEQETWSKAHFCLVFNEDQSQKCHIVIVT